MPQTLFDTDFQSVYDGKLFGSKGAFPSPADWRDCVIYFLMVDRFNNLSAKPVHQPFDDPQFSAYQGGKFSGVRDKLKYVKNVGAGAIWLSPVLKNLQFSAGSYHGYGIHDFLHAEPRFADDPSKADDELRALVDAAHAEGLYVIFDIVLNHTGDVFAYRCDPSDATCNSTNGAEASFHPSAQTVHWRDGKGMAHSDWTDIGTIANPTTDALVWPKELQRNAFFRMQGGGSPDDTIGDFASLKQMRTDVVELQNHLIRAYQYVIARFDVDGFRIDTLRYLKNNLAQTFGNSIREFALSIGKKNFFTFGEVWTGDSESVIAQFIGRNTNTDGDLVGVDAALDYPLFNALKPMVKGFSSPRNVIDMYQRRKEIEKNILSSHGDATRYFVTFLDNHDVKARLRFRDATQQNALDDEVTLGVGCLLSLPGVPCIYYGTEQGLTGAGSDAAVREALWGGPGFDESSPFFTALASMTAVRARVPALRYGRTYFRQLSGNGVDFGFSTANPGVLAFSRILNDREVLVVANAVKANSETLHVVVDSILNTVGRVLSTLYSNKSNPTAAGPVQTLSGTTAQQADGGTSRGTLTAVRVTLQPGEIQILG
jgi:glycosidase